MSDNRWYDQILFILVPPLVALLIKILMLSWRVKVVDEASLEKEALLRSGDRAIYCTWHQRMALSAHYLGRRQVTAMVSQSRDGEYAARVVRWLGFKSIRGSSTRGGRRALAEIIARLKQGEKAGMLADGPLGPARVAKMGTVAMAHRSGVPIIPLTWGTDRCWVLNSWDRYMIPKPFARVIIHCPGPIWVPEVVNGNDLEPFRRLLQERLNEGSTWCDKQFGKEQPWRKVKDKGVQEIGPLPNEI